MGKTSSTVKDRYNKKAYDTALIRFKKGSKARIEAYAKEQGKSVNGLINELLRERMGDALTAEAEPEGTE